MRCFCVSLLFLAVQTGCQQWHHTPEVMAPAQLLSKPIAYESVNALCVPPAGWIPTPMPSSSHHDQQLWISPSGDTAYGVIRIKLPIPVGERIVLWKFLDEMKKSEGEATLLWRIPDERLGGIRFEAVGGRYHVRALLAARGFSAWAVYAGSLIGRPVNLAELDLAARARDSTGFPAPAQVP